LLQTTHKQGDGNCARWRTPPVLGNDEELDKLIQEKKYEFVNTFDSRSGEKQYVYRLTYPDGRQVARNFSMSLDNVSSWADYQKKL
jgi:hypothetical protein